MKTIRYCFGIVILSVVLCAQEKIDLNTIYQIKQEAFQGGKVMDHVQYLTDAAGPRLTGSPAYKAAAEWVVKQLKEWGIDNARLEKWGPFGRGWENQRFAAHLLEPTYQPLIGFAQAWTGSTEGPVIGEPVIVSIQTDSEMEKYKGQLKGKIVLNGPAVDVLMHDKPDLHRYTDQELSDIAMAPVPGPMGPMGARAGQPNFMQQMAMRNKVAAFLREEGVAVVVAPGGQRSDGGTVFSGGGGSRTAKDPIPPASIALTAEHYNRIYRLVDKKIPVKIEIEVKNRFIEDDLDSYNVVGDIPGGRRKDEVVMVGGHLDSWHGGTGATDNAIGCAVMMEVMRIVKKLDFKLDRTVRIGLWSGEEQGLLGSRAYVKEHFSDPATMKTTPEWDKFSAYYNVDNGGGKIRGIYLQGNEAARPVMEALLAPFKDMGAATVTIRNTSGTDHQSFDGVGLPGFQFIQDELEYNARTHHSNMDVYERLQRGDAMQMAAIVTSMVVHTANREEKIPRKTKPGPRPQGGGRPF